MDNPTRQRDPAALRFAAVLATDAATTLSRAVGAVQEAGLVADDEIVAATALVTSWAAWIEQTADAARPTDRP
jgi:hypothetical protein